MVVRSKFWSFVTLNNRKIELANWSRRRNYFGKHDRGLFLLAKLLSLFVQKNRFFIFNLLHFDCLQLSFGWMQKMINNISQKIFYFFPIFLPLIVHLFSFSSNVKRKKECNSGRKFNWKRNRPYFSFLLIRRQPYWIIHSTDKHDFFHYAMSVIFVWSKTT